MKLENRELLLEFYEKLKADYPDTDLTLAQVKSIIDAPFAYLKKVMSSGILFPIRFTGFGLFTVYPRQVVSAQKDLLKRFKSGNLSEKSFEKYNTAFEDFIQRQKEYEKEDCTK